MKFSHDKEQRDFATTLDKVLAGADTVAAARAWAAGDSAPGLALWRTLAERGVTSLATHATAVEVCIAFEALGRHGVPGPWVESAAFLPIALEADLSQTIATVAVPPHVPFALDADVAQHVLAVEDSTLFTATVGTRHVSLDRARHLFEVSPHERVEAGDLDLAFDLAVLAASAQLLGAGERILADSVTYVKQRTQFGREIGSYQAIKHQLADVRIALDFARPLVDGAAVGFEGTDRARDVSAAKVAAGDAAYLASRAGLQVHGAIGYTAELDLSLWLLKVRALVNAWGTPAFHRARVLESLVRT
ncbi:acyl-CoA dehydrogenase family protein [Nocardioides sp.]|uniref:acyl-CoA dehydrogenase family protein n=1 Tax=Nocardioides sp. TaxID=35761 RepID=UPI00286E8A4F|nr:acyl-CoA dehydrogenase family protein [Nocardioides sp.]